MTPAADTPDEEARITIDGLDLSMDGLSVLAYAERGRGDYTLEIESHL